MTPTDQKERERAAGTSDRGANGRPVGCGGSEVLVVAENGGPPTRERGKEGKRERWQTRTDWDGLEISGSLQVKSLNRNSGGLALASCERPWRGSAAPPLVRAAAHPVVPGALRIKSQ